jgi:uncharacterized protein (TIGR00251 family)
MADRTTTLRLRVSPGSRRSELVGPFADGWKIRVAAPPEDGRANEAVLRLLAEKLDVPRRDVALVSGHAARDKVVAVSDLELADAQRRLQGAARKP